MKMNYFRYGAGQPLLLIHGLGCSWLSWQTILNVLSLTREIIALDLPGHGETPPQRGATKIETLAFARS